MLPAIHYNGEYCRRAKEPKEEVGAGLAWETKLIGLDRDCNSTVVACESFTGEIRMADRRSSCQKAYNSRISAVNILRRTYHIIIIEYSLDCH